MGAAEYTKDLQIYLRDEKDKIRFIYLKKPEKQRKNENKRSTHTLQQRLVYLSVHLSS